jgi:uncharacterized protein YgiM (DUF1202 family)
MKRSSRMLSVAALFLYAAALAFALEVGAGAFTKKQSTHLLAEPRRDAAATGSLPWGTKVKITAMQGLWAQVIFENKKGWVFAGNLSSDKPPAENKNDLLPATASDTTAATAARPLSQTAKDYADRKDRAASAADVEWMEAAADAVTAADVQAYMRENKKGDFAP